MERTRRRSWARALPCFILLFLVGACHSFAQDPNSAEFRSNISRLLREAQADAQAGHFDDAFSRYNQIIGMEVPAPVASYALQCRGNTYQLKGDRLHALQDWEQAIRLSPDNVGAYVNRGLALYEGQDFEGALKDYNEAIRLDPKRYKAFYGRALVQSQLNQVEPAMRDINKTMELSPDFAVAYVVRGALSAYKGSATKAEQDFATAKRLEPNLPELWWVRANLALQRKRYSEAVSHFEKLLSLKISRSVQIGALITLARLRAAAPASAVRDKTKATAAARQACELSNWQHPIAVDSFAAALAENDDFEGAVNFQWFALSLILEDDQGLRPGAEQRLHLYQSRRPYRETEVIATPQPSPKPAEKSRPSPILPPGFGPVAALGSARAI